ncbi:glycoside hydrolase family 47 protein [Conidiobolus coronatus NRRL 28638]|uniref:alpha-1,2-Mannosidase n=1 Tax=Conidiobolus coronatus (strain ATCC 28846 / CBS 209.66 / NRRL 28638) TaxID=796925 RepID=A0A137PIY8_CONC2|nr:glycoside hydrolase family 47 protein [Conidiobolus coronatus NRRL 28638]|eukprot:KXN74962.1 glycoside hydrolase family 47 protein [Conidiobolus coronatus NRRL 28638]
MIISKLIYCLLINLSVLSATPETIQILEIHRGKKLSSSGPDPLGEQDDPIKKEAVKRAFLHAWNGYKKYAWGSDEVRPISNRSVSDRFQGWGVTIVDSLSTLWLMGLKDEFYEAVNKIDDVDFTKTDRPVITFETNIRYLGGLISAYDLSHEGILLEKAKALADKMLYMFTSPSGFPYGAVDFRNNRPASGNIVNLAEIGTLQLEFTRLSQITKDPTYAKASQLVFDKLDKLRKPQKGLYPIFLDLNNGQFVSKEVTFGAAGDSFYEYLIKLHALTNGETDQWKRMYLESVEGFKTLVRKGHNGLTYLGRIDGNGNYEQTMDHLSLFMGGLLQYGDFVLNTKDNSKLGLDLTETGYQFYAQSKTGLAPDNVRWHNDRPLEFINSLNYLRPELIESLFYSWRFTHRKEYRDKAWQIFAALERYSRTNTAFACYGDVNNLDKNSQQEDVMESFFLAETLKYLYLIFDKDSTLDLNQWVFNTEAHPLRIP